MAALRITRLIPAAAVVVASACSRNVDTYRELAVPVPRGASWAWAPSPTARKAASPADSFVRQLRQSAEHLMQVRGWVESSDTGQADFLLSLDVGSPGTVREGLRDRQEMIRATTGYTTVCTTADPCTPDAYYRVFMYDAVAAGPLHRSLNYAPCRAPWERCVEVDLWRRVDGRLAWSATSVLDVDNVARASPADVERLVEALLEQLP